jgi:hypothetical protein
MATTTTFFARYFELLDGPDPISSLELVSEDLRYSIHWSADGKSRELTGGRDDLAAFIEAGDDWRGWRHHIFWSGRDGEVEFALGETRWDDGRRIGTFMVVAQLDADGRMVRYMAARTPVEQFSALGTDR